MLHLQSDGRGLLPSIIDIFQSSQSSLRPFGSTIRPCNRRQISGGTADIRGEDKMSILAVFNTVGACRLIPDMTILILVISVEGQLSQSHGRGDQDIL